MIRDIVVSHVCVCVCCCCFHHYAAVGDTPLRGDGFGAIIRVQDVRLTEVPNIYNSFRPGDVVRAEVLSLGDKRYYYLSTARNDLGVVGAKCALSGAQMVAASWSTMRCPKSGVTELRKVAKIEPK